MKLFAVALFTLSAGLLACTDTVAKRRPQTKRGAQAGPPKVTLRQIAEVKATGTLFIGAEHVAFRPDGRWRSWFSSHGSEIFEWNGTNPRQRFNAYVRHNLAVSDDGHYLLADSTMVDLRKGGKQRVVRPTLLPQKGLGKRRVGYHLRAAALSADRRHLILSRQFAPPRLIPRLGRSGKTTYRAAGATHPDGPEHFLALYDAGTGRELTKLLDDKAALVNQVALHGRHVAVFDIRAKHVLVFDRLGQAPARAVATLPLKANMNVQLRFSRDGRRLAAASLDGGCAVWETRSWRRLARWSAGPKTVIDSLDLHPGADLLATGDRAGRLSIWHHGGGGASKALYSKVLVAGDHVEGVNFSPDGKRLIVGLMGAPNRVFIFEVATR
jgi:hypothetical protein